MAGIAAATRYARREIPESSPPEPRPWRTSELQALNVPTAGGVGLNGSSPELVAAIEAAVADGRTVINLSLGEPQIADTTRSRGRARRGRRSGVVAGVAAGNEYEVLGRGSVGPRTAERR